MASNLYLCKFKRSNAKFYLRLKDVASFLAAAAEEKKNSTCGPLFLTFYVCGPKAVHDRIAIDRLPEPVNFSYAGYIAYQNIGK
ncbi:hypothetical protein Tco_0680388, partial [Tanacetum coccineum]